ncbi:glycerophosphodiester phosphodiesterase [Sphingobium sufflavum]|uniref:glycerophosphodiester phosphodiesterase family protein n=1 Tax=Sphingobium sufflavum TaxID=1129547 RepID=UPI001F3C4F93|nr:glycerophosphodiester phosphodiesterase family protein [Sphingobium sufflavum]MCE7795519.1 glycerophosphodiester phosphodiesterase [Sphingobium sufflavum]
MPRWLLAQPYAHRGLHGVGPDGGIVPENSLGAFRRAVAAGFGIECDVRRAADDVPHVFHDASLERLTSVAGVFDRLDSVGAAALRLRDGTGVPSLRAMLECVGGRVPILVEVKSGRTPIHRLCRSIAAVLDGYDGPVAVMSFDPRVSGWFASHRRGLPRGLVLSSRGHPAFAVERRHALAIARARPHFLACDIRDQTFRPTRAARCVLPTLFWTVRSGSDRCRARAGQGQTIFERRGGAEGHG